MFKCGSSAAGPQQERSLLPGAERPKREHAWNNMKRATAVQATQEPKATMLRANQLQPYSNHTSRNPPLARPTDNQSKSSMKPKLSSVMTGQGKANDAGRCAARIRPAGAKPECLTSAINKQRFGRGKKGRAFRRDKASPSHEDKSGKGKMHTDGIRNGRSSKTTKKRESAVRQHPLAKSFIGKSRWALSTVGLVDRYLRSDHMYRPIAIFWNMLFLL